jgi:hypothetical protein
MDIQLAVKAVGKAAAATWPLDAAHKLVDVGVIHLQSIQWNMLDFSF